jgi:glycosyltransferase involved in cell wall biosynthesis
MEEPELTIGIATYNGQMFLTKVLESIINEAVGKSVEILVSDNASTDETASIVKDFQSRYPDMVRHVRNARNIGFDANVDNVVCQARGRFVWLMADDDPLVEGAVDAVLNAIHMDSELALIFVNFYNPIDLGLSGDVHCRDGNQFFAINRFKNGLLSSNIVNRKTWMEMDMKRFDGCLWIHFAYAIQAMAPKEGRTGYVIARELVKQEGGGRWGKGGSFIFTGLKLVHLFSHMEDLGYSRKVKKRGDFVVKGGYPRNIPWAKHQGLKVDRDLLSQTKQVFGQYPSYWLVDLPMFLVPNMFYDLAFNTFHKIKRKTD